MLLFHYHARAINIRHGGSVEIELMAQIHFQPPDPLDFKNPEDWPRWKQRFEQFRVASGLVDQDAKKQVSTLLYCLGEQAETVLSSTNISEEQRKVYDSVIGKFDSFFKVTRNVIFERARFNRRVQLEGESAEQFIVELYNLVEFCNYGDLASEMIRDRLVVGIRDRRLSERLQLDSELTLEKAKRAIRQSGAVQGQQHELKGTTTEPSSSLDKLQTGTYKQARNAYGRRPQSEGGKKRRQPSIPSKSCTRCGKGSHPRDKCPAKDAVCHRCNRKGHFMSCCLTKSLSEVSHDGHLDTAFLDTVTEKSAISWQEQIVLNGNLIPFKLDTGAEVTAIAPDTYHNLQNVELRKPERILSGPSRKPLKVIGQFQGHFVHRTKQTSQAVFVVEGLKTNLLGLPTITALNLAVRVDSITDIPEQDIPKQFPSLFQGLGNLGEEYDIQLKSEAKPFAIFTPRHVALPLRTKVQQELNRMESLGVISRVDQPTPWCAGIVVVPKKNGDIRICVDLKPLNCNVLREVHPLPTVDETLAQLSGACVFSKLDANSGFWQIPLTASSKLLTTFLTHNGRYCFNKLPFGISSAPEHYQKRMGKILQNLPGVLCHMDDVLVFGRDTKEHDMRLEKVLQQIQAAGATLNQEKCQFRKSSLKFLGHLIDQTGIRPDPDKTSAIAEMPTPKNPSDLRRFMGMINQFGKFSSNLAELTEPLRQLLSKKNSWSWGYPQDQAFAKVKLELMKPTVLALFDVNADLKVSADASCFGLGAVLLQSTNSCWQPVAFASRVMTDTERRYAQVEKEALALTWACEKFSTYILGKKFMIETDHKPLVPLLGTKHLDDLPPRVLRFRLRLSRFEYDIKHVPGKQLYTADTLSRAPISTSESYNLHEEADLLMQISIDHLPASSQRIDEIKKAQASDTVCSTLVSYCENGWPEKHALSLQLKPYWKWQGQLSTHNRLLLYGTRIVIPSSMQPEILQKLHDSHQGIQRCRLRAKTSVRWPGISKQISDVIERCPICVRDSPPRREPLIPSKLPDHPWQKIGTDLFYLKKSNYILIIDYFSRYIEVIKLKSTTSQAIIEALQSVFSRHGIPETVVSDNGPQYSSNEFDTFAKRYNFIHTTSSPLFPQSNGQVERAVQTVKRLLSQSDDPYMALLTYRSTPLPWCNLSPSELLMGRRLRTTLPVVPDQLIPSWPYLDKFRNSNEQFKQRQKADYDRRHRTHPLAPIPNDTEVWVTSGSTPSPGRVTAHSSTPRSYIVETPQGEMRRNRLHLNVVPNGQSSTNISNNTTPVIRNRPVTRSVTGTAIHPPDRLSY